MKTEFKNVDDYINQFPAEIRKLLEQVRSTIKKAAPKIPAISDSSINEID